MITVLGNAAMRRKSRSTRQSLTNLRGEIAFREKLSRQHVTGEVVLPDYYKKKDHDKILLERVEATSNRLGQLVASGIQLSPFLELGAERGQRSLVLTNDFDAQGVAVDISYHQLKTMEHFAKLFDRPKLPVRICCDANHLPLKSTSFPFVFCYQFLHHFPDLLPIVREIHRVVANGYFFFDEEPLKRVLKLKLYTQKSKVYSDIARSKRPYIRLLETFISEAPSDEVEHGIVENHDIALADWIKALRLFDERELELVSTFNVRSRVGERLGPRNTLSFLLGGTISGLCRKGAQPEAKPRTDIKALLACPDCATPATDGTMDQASLREVPNGFECTRCEVSYPVKDGVVFLLPRGMLEQLYPDVANER